MEVGGGVFRVTHPYHPLFSRQFEAVGYWERGGERRLYFYNGDRRLVSIPLAFTNLATPDPFLVRSAGRSLFRIKDLLELSRLIKTINLKAEGGV